MKNIKLCENLVMIFMIGIWYYTVKSPVSIKRYFDVPILSDVVERVI